MVKSLLFPSAAGVLIKVDRESCDRLGQDPHTGIHGGHLHGIVFVDGFSGCRAAEKETIAASGGAVLRFVPGMEQAFESSHAQSSP